MISQEVTKAPQTDARTVTHIKSHSGGNWHLMLIVLVSYCCSDELPHIQKLKITQIYSYTCGGQNSKTGLTELKFNRQPGAVFSGGSKGASIPRF